MAVFEALNILNGRTFAAFESQAGLQSPVVTDERETQSAAAAGFGFRFEWSAFFFT